MNTCRDCGCQFEGYVSQQRCNPCRDSRKRTQCREIQQRRRDRRIKALGGPWKCQHCGEGEIWSQQKKYCSRACQDAVNRHKSRYRYQQRETRKADEALFALQRTVRQPRSHIPRRAPTLAATPPEPSQAALHRGEALTGAAGATVQASSAQKRSE